MMKRATTLLLLAFAAIGFGAVANAQTSPAKNQAAPQNTTTQQKKQNLIQAYRQKTTQLNQIQKKAMKNDPKLVAEQKQLQSEVEKSMLAHGYDMKKGKQRVQKMIAKAKSGDKMSKDQRQAAMKSFQAERQKMMKARMAAMHEPKIKQDRKKLEDNTIAAMKKQDSHTSQLLKDVKSLRAKIMAMAPAKSGAMKQG